MISKDELEFYKKQGVRTNVDVGTFKDLPDSIDKIVRIIQGLLIHPCTLVPLYNLTLPKQRIKKERSFKTVREVLKRIHELDRSPLVIPREPRNRVIAICKHFSMFLCAILREKGLPARTRCGFATYFTGGWFEDHWICEYWNSHQSRWVRVDAQIDDIQASNYGINRDIINSLDLPKGVFFPAGVLWKLYRDGFVDGQAEGFSGNKERGEWYIRGNMLRDFFALNEIEYLYSEEDMLMKKNVKFSPKELALLDTISDYTSKPDINFENLRNLYVKNKALMPK